MSTTSMAIFSNPLFATYSVYALQMSSCQYLLPQAKYKPLAWDRITLDTYRKTNTRFYCSKIRRRWHWRQLQLWNICKWSAFQPDLHHPHTITGRMSFLPQNQQHRSTKSIVYCSITQKPGARLGKRWNCKILAKIKKFTLIQLTTTHTHRPTKAQHLPCAKYISTLTRTDIHMCS